MNLSVTVTLSGDGATRRKAVEVEDAVAKAVEEACGAVPKATYPGHRNGSIGFVLTVGEPAPKQPRARRPKADPPDPAVPIDNPDVPAPVEV